MSESNSVVKSIRECITVIVLLNRFALLFVVVVVGGGVEEGLFGSFVIVTFLLTR